MHRFKTSLYENEILFTKAGYQRPRNQKLKVSQTSNITEEPFSVF